jgi:F1F0 ATPase subunit 2
MNPPAASLDAAAIVVGMIVGATLALVFFVGLWGTVSHLTRARRPLLLLSIGLALRLALVLGVFYLLVRDGHWQRGLAALIGFVLVRAVVMRRVRRQVAAARSASQGRSS